MLVPTQALRVGSNPTWTIDSVLMLQWPVSQVRVSLPSLHFFIFTRRASSIFQELVKSISLTLRLMLWIKLKPKLFSTEQKSVQSLYAAWLLQLILQSFTMLSGVLWLLRVCITEISFLTWKSNGIPTKIWELSMTPKFQRWMIWIRIEKSSSGILSSQISFPPLKALAVLFFMSSVIKPTSLERKITRFSWIPIMVRVGAYWKNLLRAFHIKGQSSRIITPQSTWWLIKLFEDILLNPPSNLTLARMMDVQPSMHWFPIIPVKPNNVVSWGKGSICWKISNGMGELIL